MGSMPFVSSHGHGAVFQKFLDNVGPLRSQSVIICIECMGHKNKAKTSIALGIKNISNKIFADVALIFLFVFFDFYFISE